MFDNPYSIIKVIGILSGIAYIIFRFQVISEIRSGFRKWKNDKNKRELNTKVADYLSKHQSNELSADNEEFMKNFIDPIKLNIHRIIVSDNKYSIYFANSGSNVSNLIIHSDDVNSIRIEPKMNFPNGSGGCITFYNQNNNLKEVKIKLEYTDERMNRNIRKYLLSLPTKTIREIF